MSGYNGYYGNNEGFITRLTNYYDASGTDISLKIPNFYTGTFIAVGTPGTTHTLSIYMNAPPTSFIFSSSYVDTSVNDYICTQTIIVGWYFLNGTYHPNTTTYYSIASGAYIGLLSDLTTNFSYSNYYFNMTITESPYISGYTSFVQNQTFGYSILVLN
jgi:hypothetical protein